MCLKGLKRTRIKRGSAVWYLLVTINRVKEKKLPFVKAFFDSYLIKKRTQARLSNRALQPDCVTVIITSAGREAYLDQTIYSLRENLRYDSARVKWYIIDDFPDSRETRAYIKALEGFDLKIQNPTNEGLGYALNKIYAEVTTEFVFHCEDDWLFLRPIQLERMMTILRENPYLRQLILYRHIAGREHFGVKTTDRDYAEYFPKFSFNPHLAFTSLFVANQPFPLHYTELEYTLKLERNGWRTSGIFEFGALPHMEHLGVEKKASKK